jgi:hypothetical protein
VVEQGKRASAGLDVKEAAQRNFLLDAAGKKRCHAVVVALADGIGFVIVATGAFQRHSKEGRADGVDSFGSPFSAIEIAVVGVFDGERAEGEQAGADAAIEVLLLLLRQVQGSFQIRPFLWLLSA